MIIVVGGGASGLLASSKAAENGNEVLLLEKNEKLGKKLYITGKGRCNVTNDCAPRDFLDSVVRNPKFLTGAVYSFSSDDVMKLFEAEGVPITVERGNRVFPASGKSSDIIKALQQKCQRAGVKILLNTAVLSVSHEKNVFLVKTSNGDFTAEKVIVATGGLSYPLTGSTGDGYAFARGLGHTIIKPTPSLCPIILKEGYVKDLEGLSLKNVSAEIFADGKSVASDFGEMLFTSNGVSGPIILTLSAKANKRIEKGGKITLSIDLKPALTPEQLDKRVLSDFNKNVNKEYKNSLSELLPRKLIPIIIKLSKIPPETPVNQISAEQRKVLVNLLKNLSFGVKGLDKIDVAVVTAGGVDVAEVNPKTCESKLVPGLYFIGEVLDVDALTGGFNLQIAFSTAAAAARALSKK